MRYFALVACPAATGGLVFGAVLVAFGAAVFLVAIGVVPFLGAKLPELRDERTKGCA